MARELLLFFVCFTFCFGLRPITYTTQEDFYMGLAVNMDHEFQPGSIRLTLSPSLTSMWIPVSTYWVIWTELTHQVSSAGYVAKVCLIVPISFLSDLFSFARHVDPIQKLLPCTKHPLVELKILLASVLTRWWRNSNSSFSMLDIWKPFFPEACFARKALTLPLSNANCWVGNRSEGSMTKIGMEETGQCVDRNGNGIIDTSRVRVFLIFGYMLTI